MKAGMRVRKLILSLLLIAILGVPTPVRAAELTVFAAASLTEVFQQLTDEFEKVSGTEVICHFAGSQILRFQLEQGAPADVIALADPVIMDRLIRQRLVVAPQIFARNQLELIVSPYATGKLQGLEDLARPDTLVVIGNEQVPVGRYTRQLLSKLPDAVLNKKILNNVVSEESSVKGVVSKVLLGEADAGFVYATDLTNQLKQRGVTTIDLPQLNTSDARYPVAVTTDTEQPDAAQAFVEFLLSPNGQRILHERNFLTGSP